MFKVAAISSGQCHVAQRTQRDQQIVASVKTTKGVTTVDRPQRADMWSPDH
ncbi:hypothetical protein MAB47J26_08827 [Mycobacteroides abscessus 47J26]|nr:hypothetical protein MAB47J26_08827 [Mycobacteroides abscessus 47J26]